MRSIRVLLAFCLLLVGGVGAADTASPYAGQEQREIKALSPTEIEDLLAGRGMGLAKAAELNGYPGPAHVLELADRLQLTPEQRTATQALFEGMSQDARRLGAAIVAAERDLERGFAEHRLDEGDLQARLNALGALQAELRFVHLRTHLAQAALLTPAQIARYDALRGYDRMEAPARHGKHGSHGAHGSPQ